MSRIGAKSIEIPNGVTVESAGGVVLVKGPKGELTYKLLKEIGVDTDGKTVKVKRVIENPEAKARHGLARSLIQNMIIGVAEGHERKLEIVGVGYKAQLKGKILVFRPPWTIRCRRG